LSKLQELINQIKKDEQIIRFQELENIIDHNKSITTDYNQLLDLQKVMVKKEFEQSSSLPQAKEEYDIQLQKVLKYPIIEEYLDLLEIINNDLSLIKRIIEQEIALDFD
jgi:cell fate (sporulation/competence/biofilm development) regulator YmcA (YheA/YmcA/DUF963 family)